MVSRQNEQHRHKIDGGRPTGWSGVGGVHGDLV
jgi:hypothetical protein